MRSPRQKSRLPSINWVPGIDLASRVSDRVYLSEKSMQDLATESTSERMESS